MRKTPFLFALLFPLLALAQSETHDFVTYDTTIVTGVDKWLVRVSRPKTDTAARPAIISIPGQGEQGPNAAPAKTQVYGPHYWLNNGWDGGIILGNGVHYPILITAVYTNNVYPTAPAAYRLLTTLLATFHIKERGHHVAGLSQGAFTWGALILYEDTKGAETGMKLVTSLTALEGTPDPLPQPYASWSRGVTAYKVWAKKYGGRYFYLEGSGSDNMRDGWQYAKPMNDTVPGSAYFSYEKLGGGAHCCWNDMYNPKTTNWTSVGTLGPNNAPSQRGTNQMGSYFAPSSLFQWMLRQGDTSLVVPAPPVIIAINKPPVPVINTLQTITAPTAWVVLDGSASFDPDGKIDSIAYTKISGPAGSTLLSTSCDLVAAAVGLAVGTHVYKLQVWDTARASTQTLISVVVNPAPIASPIEILRVTTPDGRVTIYYSDGSIK